ncbi:MAG: hypothetical protein M1155_02825 [Patescibacteria group bacterium]|nr:hypothetical protein [Patescibacteria group bacterium]
MNKFERIKNIFKQEKRTKVEFGIPKPEKVLGVKEEAVKKEGSVKEITENKKEESPIKIIRGEGFTMREKTLEEKDREGNENNLLKKENEERKEKENNKLRENFAKAQLEFERARRAGGYDREDYDKKTGPLKKDLEEAKKAYFEFLKKNEGKDAGEKIKFTVEEFNKLQDIKINLRSAEETKKTFLSRDLIKEVGNWYRKQPAKQKYIVSAGLIGGGIVAGIAGSAVLASVVGTTAIVSRILSGTGTAMALENAIAQGKGKKFGMHIGHKGLMDEMVSEEIEKITKGGSVDSVSGFFEKNEEALSAASERLYKESKRLETQRALISGAMGALIATGSFGEVLKDALHWTGADKAAKDAFDWAKHLFAGQAVEKNIGATVGGAHAAVSNAPAAHEIGSDADIHKMALPDSEDLRKLATVRKGEGITQVLERQLEHDPAKFGFTGYDINNASEVHKWAQQHAYELAVKNGFISENGGDIVRGTQHVLEKDPLHYGFKGDVEDVTKVHEWALKQAQEVASKTGTNVPKYSEVRVRWDYSHGADKQAAYVLGSDGKITEVLPSGKNPDYLYESARSGAKPIKGADLINKQIEESNKAIDKLNLEVEKEYRHNIVPGARVSHHYEKMLDSELKHEQALEARQKALFGGKPKIHTENNLTDKFSGHVGSKAVEAKSVDAEKAVSHHVEPDHKEAVRTSPKASAEHFGHENNFSSGAEKVPGFHQETFKLDDRSKIIFKLNKDNKIIGTVWDYKIDGGHQLNTEKILKGDWFDILRKNTKGTRDLSLAGDVVEARSKDIAFQDKVLERLKDLGRGNGPEAEFLRKNIAQTIEMTEKKYGDVFK